MTEEEKEGLKSLLNSSDLETAKVGLSILYELIAKPKDILKDKDFDEESSIKSIARDIIYFTAIKQLKPYSNLDSYIDEIISNLDILIKLKKKYDS